MIKKLITISVFLGLAMTLGLVGAANAADATGHDAVTFTADTDIGTSSSHQDLVAKALGEVATFAVGASDVSITLLEGSDITFESASGKIMSVSGCTAAYTTFTADVPSTMRIVWNGTHCTSAVLTIGEGALTDVNVAAGLLTADTASAYTVTFRTVNPLIAGQKIKLVFGGGFTIADSDAEAMVTTFTDDSDPIGTLGDTGLVADAATETITITLPTGATVAAKSVINIVLDGTEVTKTLITNPTTASADTAVSGIDIYTTTSGGTTIDKKEDQTAFNRVIDLEPGWNIFAPSQELENSDKTIVLTPITAYVSTIYTLTRATAGVMSWTTPTTIDPLYGYAIYITGGSTVKLPLDFAKETANNSVFSRSLAHAGWYLIGYTGTETDPLQRQDAFLDGLTVASSLRYSVVVDLTGTDVNNVPSSHLFGATTTTEVAESGDTDDKMDFCRDFGYAIFTTSDGLVLGGSREE